MSVFKIVIKIDKEYFDESVSKKIVYYQRQDKKFYDDVEFSSDIVISGKRWSDIEKNAMETVESTYYLDMVKSLLFVYLTKGDFIVKSIDCYVDEKLCRQYDEVEIFQNFKKAISYVNEISTDMLFAEDKDLANDYMDCLMNFILSDSNEDECFSYLYKCFNYVLTKFIAKDKNTENEKLKEFRNFLEENEKKYTHTQAFIESLDSVYDYLNQCRIGKYLYNEHVEGILEKNKVSKKNKDQNKSKEQIEKEKLKEKEKKEKRIKNFYEDFTDVSVCKALKDHISYLNNYKDLQAYCVKCLDKNIENNNTNSIDFVRFVCIKYTYFLRCKYFHGENKPANFLIHNDNYNELIRVSRFLKEVCIDTLKLI